MLVVDDAPLSIETDGLDGAVVSVVVPDDDGVPLVVAPLDVFPALSVAQIR